MPSEIDLCGFTLTEEEWLELDEDTRQLASPAEQAFPYEAYEVVLEPIPGLN